MAEPLAEGAALARVAAPPTVIATRALAPLRYRVQFTASQRYVELLEEARNLLQHQVPDRPLRATDSRTSAPERVTREDDALDPERMDAADSNGSAPERVTEMHEGPASERMKPQQGPSFGRTSPRDALDPEAHRGRHIPAETRRAVWRRDEGRCTFTDASGRRGAGFRRAHVERRKCRESAG